MKDYAEPHFQDEQTLLTARPVVPLEEINAKARNRRLWFLAGALVIAMMLGAASALLASYVKLRNAPQNAPQVVTEVSEPEPELAPEPEPGAVAESVPAEETPVVENENAENSEEVILPPVAPKRESAVRRRTVAARESDEPRDSRELSEEDELQRIRRSVLYEQWQERRERRVRRERRRAERYNHRDLSNLDEIFEGRRRP